jgi:hypothetical protein
VKDDTAITEESRVSWSEGEVLVSIVRGKAWECGNGSMFAAQVANLAGSRAALVAWRRLATSEWVEMSGGSSAISIRWHSLVMNVVD